MGRKPSRICGAIVKVERGVRSSNLSQRHSCAICYTHNLYFVSKVKGKKVKLGESK
jgi:hypothetical protein